MVQTSDAVFASIVLLEGSLKSEMSYLFVIKKRLEIDIMMSYLLKRIVYMPTERCEVNWLTEADTLL